MVQTPPPRSKLVRCARHGVYYNPETSNECSVCRSSAEAEQKTEGLRFSPFQIAGVVAVVAGGFFLFGRATRSVGERGAVVAERAAEEMRLDPVEYRRELEAIESLVYADNPRQFDHGAAIFRETSALSAKIMQRGGGVMVQARNSQYGLEIMSFGQRQASTDDVGYGVFDLSMAQSDWEAVRRDVFQDADWLHPSTGANGGSQNRMVTASMDPGTVLLLRDMATGLENAMRFGRQQAMRVGELSGDRRSAEARRTQESWESVRRPMTTSLQATVSRLPNDGRLMNSEARSAHQLLDQAADRMASLLSYNDVPSRSVRESAFDAAESYINEAKRYLAQL